MEVSASGPRSASAPAGGGAPELRRPRARGPVPAWSVALLCLLVAVALNALLVHQRGLSGDEAYYERMATHPGGPHNFPYAFRVGLPYVVHLLPFSHGFSWELLALLAAGGAGGVMYALLRELGTGPGLAAGLGVGLTVSPPLLVVLLRNGRGIDALAMLVITLGCLFAVRRQRLALTLTLLVGCTVHEACLFLIPFTYALWAERPLDPRALRELAAVAVVPAVAYVLLRSTIVAVGEAYQPGYGSSFLRERYDVIREGLTKVDWKVELRRLALAFGPLWLAAPAGLRSARSGGAGGSGFARRGLVLVALCVGSMTFALDWGRAIFFAAPVFYAAAAAAVRGRRRLAVMMVVALLAMDVGYAVYMQVHGVRHGLDNAAPPARGPVV